LSETSSSAPKKPFLPSREELIQFIESNPESGKRDIVKALGLKGEARQWLSDILQDLQAEGLFSGKKQKKRKTEAKLPPVAVLEITERNADGILLARLSENPGKGGKTKTAKKARAPENLLIALSSPSIAGKSKTAPAGIGSRILAKIFPAKGDDKKIAPYEGRIIRILDKQPAAILGIIQKSGQSGHYRLEPVDRKQNSLLIEQRDLNGAEAGDLVLAETLSQSDARKHQFTARFGRVKEKIGKADNEKSLSTIALYAHNIPSDFSKEVLAEAELAAEQSAARIKQSKREDWSAIPFVTIDPETAKDHDDAVFARADNNPQNRGGHIIYVAIADVSAYVQSHSAMDKEARERGNSVYFPDRVVPMLPEIISNNLCSLREGEDRPALAAKIILSAKGQMLRHSFHRVIIRSRAKLSYEQAQMAIDGQADAKTAPILDIILRPLWAAYAALKIARKQRQPLELNLPERKLFLDENGRINDVRAIARLDAHRLIEDFMIAANIAAAETLKAKNKRLLFRIHDSPSLAKQEGLRELLANLGIKLGTGADITPEKLNNILTKAKGNDYEELVNQLVLRAQAQAEYSPDNIGHFGLKLRYYAHFTSPIRRYADLLIHRGLIKALDLGDNGITAEDEAELENIAASLSSAERRAMLAERETNDRLIAHYLSDNVGAEFHGRVNGVTRAGLFVTLDKTGADGFVSIAGLKKHEGDYYHFDEAHFALINECSRKGYQLGDAVEVRLMEVQKSAGSLRFEILSAPKKLPFSAKSFHKATCSRRPQRPFRGKKR